MILDQSMVPRVRGRVSLIEEPIEDAGKFVYEVSFWDHDGEEMLTEPLMFGPFESEEKAKEAGRDLVEQAVKSISDSISNVLPGVKIDVVNFKNEASGTIH